MGRSSRMRSEVAAEAVDLRLAPVSARPSGSRNLWPVKNLDG